MSWRPAKSLDVLLKQVNEKWPGRDKSSDGTIGDEAHSARTSDHNPNDSGVVCARDITHDPVHGPDARKLAVALIVSRDDRIKYIISNAEICSGSGQKQEAWVWRPYTGINAHRQHMHLSVKADPAHYDNTVPWALDGAAASPLVAQHDARWLQRRLNELGASPKLDVDGDIGEETIKIIEKYLPKVREA